MPSDFSRSELQRLSFNTFRDKAAVVPSWRLMLHKKIIARQRAKIRSLILDVSITKQNVDIDPRTPGV